MRTLAILLFTCACVGDSPSLAQIPDSSTQDVVQPGVDASKGDAAVTTDSSDAATTPPVPATLAGVVLWLDAQEASTLKVTNNKLTKWVDRSSFQHDAVADVGFEPSVGMDSSRNLPIVRFNSSSMILNGQGADKSLQFNSDGDFLVEIVMLNTNNGAIILHNMDTTAPKSGINIVIISGEQKLAFGLNST